MTAPHPPPARSGTGPRFLRAAVFAAVCVVLAAAGHSLASCATVPVWSLGVGFLGVALVAAPLAGRVRSLPGIAALLAVGQTALHMVFGLGQHGTAAATATTNSALSDASLVRQAARLVCGTAVAAISPAQAQRILADARVLPDGTGGTAAGGVPADAMPGAGTPAAMLPSLPMLLGHVLAAVAAGWLLRHGDLALARLAGLSVQSARAVAERASVRALRALLALVRTLHAGLAGAPRTGPRPARTALPSPARPHTVALQHTVIRRGPPDRLALAA
ncbi:hypothetical protein [Streptomyces sp. SHP 1-2]|uniref:hypothetical protein n=1 Tax=Streptomyces sp. SHP 1-2 TaxID=2769489 RepID=UPI002237F901|nr:hypothetical protein [Streptomyces sp. SHP 1-2]MCW5250057.1 hypothetical protein [Streptomyces sp. SHP 1-2]